MYLSIYVCVVCTCSHLCIYVYVCIDSLFCSVPIRMWHLWRNFGVIHALIDLSCFLMHTFNYACVPIVFQAGVTPLNSPLKLPSMLEECSYVTVHLYNYGGHA